LFPSRRAFQNRFLLGFRVLFEDRGLDWHGPVWSGSRFDKRPRRMFEHSPQAIPWERQLPWAPTTIIPNTAVVPVSGRPKSGGPARGSACAKGASGSISRSVRISVTVRIPTAGARSAAGRRRGDRPAAVRIPGFRPSTLRPNACAVSEPRPRRNLRNERRLRPRVVTQQNFFSNSLCDRPGCYEPPAHSIRNPARYCCASCRQAVRNVLDRERKWKSGNTLAGRLKRAHQSSRRAGAQSHPSPQQRDTSSPDPPRSPLR